MSPRSSGFPWNSRQKVELLIEKAKRILRNEGLPGLVERVKRRISRRFEKNYSAIAVTHQEGMKWFEFVLISAAMPSFLMLERISVTSLSFSLRD